MKISLAIGIVLVESVVQRSRQCHGLEAACGVDRNLADVDAGGSALACTPRECKIASPEPLFENAQRAPAPGLALAIYERALAGTKAAADRGRVVWRPAPARTQPELA